MDRAGSDPRAVLLALLENVIAAQFEEQTSGEAPQAGAAAQDCRERRE